MLCFFFSSRRRHTRCSRDWSSDVCSSDLPQITVRLTDAPFPYDSLHSVNIYVVRIEAEADTADTSGGGQWTVITEPRKTFDLLALQQGATAILGQGEMPAGQYRAVRMTIDTS